MNPAFLSHEGSPGVVLVPLVLNWPTNKVLESETTVHYTQQPGSESYKFKLESEHAHGFCLMQERLAIDS